MIIRQPLLSEINLLKGFPPEEWNFNLPEFLSFHYGQPYFYPIIAEVDGAIAGFGNGILNNKVGWIGNIIVSSEHRRQGIGHQLTSHLVDYFNNNGCTTQILIASNMGKNIYSRIGFQSASSYHFLKTSEIKNYPKPKNIISITEEYYPIIKTLDYDITGEKRFPLIERFLSTCFLYKCGDNSIGGYFLPDLGGGAILAVNEEAGRELLKFRLSFGKTNAVIPAENTVAYEFLINEGFTIYQTLPRMILGEEVNWKPSAVFNRATGYAG